MILNYSQFDYLYDCVYMNDTDESDSSEVVSQCLNLFFCLVKHAGDLSQAQAQSLSYLLTAGVQLGGLASVKVCGNEMVYADLILIEREHSQQRGGIDLIALFQS